MIGISERDNVEVPRVEPGHIHGEVVGLRAAVDEVDALQGLGQSLGQAFGVLMNFRLKKTDCSGSGILDPRWVLVTSMGASQLSGGWVGGTNPSNWCEV